MGEFELQQEAYQKPKEEAETRQIPLEIKKEHNALQISRATRENRNSFTVPRAQGWKNNDEPGKKINFFRVIQRE